MRRRSGITAVLAIAVLAGSAACGGGDSKAAPQQTPTPTVKPTKDPVTSCVEQLVYWANEGLRGSPEAGDYQHMGLTSDKYDALRKILKDAKAVLAKGKLPPTWLEDQTRPACVKIYATPKASNTVGGWPQ